MKNSVTVIVFIVWTGLSYVQAQGYAFAKKAAPAFIIPESISEAPVKSIVLKNGVKLEYVEQGNPKGTPVIFLHGYTDSYHSYDLVLPHLPSSLHVFSITLRGHGNSDKPQSGYTPADFATDVAQFLDRVHIRKAIIAGHSMGGVIAQQFAVNYPGYVSGLVLISTFARLGDKPAILEFQKQVQQLTDPIDPAFAKEFQQSTLHKEVPADFFQTAVEQSLKVPARVWSNIVDGLVVTDLTKELPKVNKPAIVFWGDQDVYCPAKDQQDLVAALPGSIFQTYTGIGHALHWEAPQRFATDLVNFINSIAKR